MNQRYEHSAEQKRIDNLNFSKLTNYTITIEEPAYQKLAEVFSMYLPKKEPDQIFPESFGSHLDLIRKSQSIKYPETYVFSASMSNSQIDDFISNVKKYEGVKVIDNCLNCCSIAFDPSSEKKGGLVERISE